MERLPWRNRRDDTVNAVRDRPAEVAKPDPVKRQPLRIGEWRIDSTVNEFDRAGRTVRIEPKVMEVLMALAERAGEVVSREELLAAVWPGVVVGDDALTQSIIKLRKALGDKPRSPAYIETISKRGYRDRKSTRLNSSHMSISYAVFCLKKKTKQKHK